MGTPNNNRRHVLTHARVNFSQSETNSFPRGGGGLKFLLLQLVVVVVVVGGGVTEKIQNKLVHLPITFDFIFSKSQRLRRYLAQQPSFNYFNRSQILFRQLFIHPQGSLAPGFRSRGDKFPLQSGRPRWGLASSLKLSTCQNPIGQ